MKQKQSTSKPRRSSRSSWQNGDFSLVRVIQAAKTFSGEIVLDKLLQKLLQAMLEITGAQRGYLLLKVEGNWLPKAGAAMTGRESALIDYSAGDLDQMLAYAVVSRVIDSQQTIVYDNACVEPLFADDAYIQKNRSKSIFCMPVHHQKELVCVVYLENNLVTGAFASWHQETLSLLGSQAGISIKNSRLYEELDKTVKELHEEIAKRTETQLQLLHASKLSALGRLSTSLAHEFGNPLIGITYLLEDLKNRTELSAEDRHLIDVGLEECERMRSLIDDLHTLYAPSTGEKTGFNLNEVVRSVLLFQRKALKNSNIWVHTELAGKLPDAYAVKDQITQVIASMVQNGAKAMSKGGTLSIKTEQRGNQIVIAISDTGRGIAPARHEHVFEPFFSTEQDHEGTGLGLALAYFIIKNHGGDITFDSAIGTGSSFSISLPLSGQ